MPRGLDPTIIADLDDVTSALPLYAVRIFRSSETLFWATRGDGTGSGEHSVIIDGDNYEARLQSLSGFEYGPDESGQISIVVSNVDMAVRTLDQNESFSGCKIEVLEYLPGIDDFSVRWSGFCLDVSEISHETATIPAMPAISTPNVMVPRRMGQLPCAWLFGKPEKYFNYLIFEGAECSYQRESTVGFVAELQWALDATTDPITFVIRWHDPGFTAGALFKQTDEIWIGTERLAVTNTPDPPDGLGDQLLVCARAVRGTTIATHAELSTIRFANCQKSPEACKFRGMYGNNPDDTYASGAKRANYFGGYPYVTAYQHGSYRTVKGGKANPARLEFSGNESAYGMTLPLVYGMARVNTAILAIAKAEGDFMSSLWFVAEGLLATNADDDSQAEPLNAYFGGNTAALAVYVNGISRHDPRPGFGVEAYNGAALQPNPGSSLMSGIADFTDFHLGFIGTAWLVLRINTKNNPSVDVSGQSISGAFVIRYGRVVNVYSDPDTFVRQQTTIPSWVMMDLQTSTRTGGGMDYSRLKIQSYIDHDAYCAELVTDVVTGASVRRWTFNGVLDQRKSLGEWLHLISLSCYSLPPFLDKDGLYKIKALKAESLDDIPLLSSKVASTTGRNIIWTGPHSGLVKSRRPITEVPNEIRATFVNRTIVADVYQFTKTTIVVVDPDAQEALGVTLGDGTRRVISKSIDLPGVSTVDEALRLATLILRAGEFGQGGLSNNCKVKFQMFYRGSANLEMGDIVEVEDDLLDGDIERYFRIIHMSDQETKVGGDGTGFWLSRDVEAVLHANEIYDDTALTVARFDRIDPPDPFDMQPPPVTGFTIIESGIFDANGKSQTNLVIEYTEPDPIGNFRSLVIMRSNDDGSGDPVGDWRIIGEVLESGESVQYEVTGNFERFCAVSRPLSGHLPDEETLDAAGDFVYPRVRILVDGNADQILPAPENLQAFGRLHHIYLTWDAYTGNDLKLFSRFIVFRGLTSDPDDAAEIGRTDTNWFSDESDDVAEAPSTTFWYFVKGVASFAESVIDGVTIDGLSDFSGGAHDNPGTDDAVPNAPVTNVEQTGPLSFLVGTEPPGSPTDYDTVESYEIQITTDATFVSFPAGMSFSQVIARRLPDVQTFTPIAGGTFHLRTRAINIFGNSSWSTTENFFTDGVSSTSDSDVADPPVGLALAISTSGNPIGGNTYQAQFTYPTANVAQAWGYYVFLHDSATPPSTTTQYTNTNGVLVAGSNRLTVPSNPFTPSQWVSPDAHDVVIFSPKRTGSPTWDLEAAVYIMRITGNGAGYLDFAGSPGSQLYSWTGLTFWIVKSGVGDHFHEKVKAQRASLDRNDIQTIRREDFQMQITGVRAFAVINNLWGNGKLAGPTGSTSFVGVSTTELKALAVTTGKIDTSSVTSGKISVSSLSTINSDLGTITAGTVTGGTVRNTSSGNSRIQFDSSSFTVTDSGGTEFFKLAPGAIGVKAQMTGIEQHPNIGGSFSMTTRPATNDGDFVHLEASGTSAATKRSSIDVIPGTAGTGKIVIKVQDGVIANIGSTGYDGDINLRSNSRVFQPRYVAQGLTGGATPVSMANGEWITVKDTDTNLFYLVYQDPAGTQHSVQVV